MQTVESEPLIDISQIPARYSVTDAAIAELASKYDGLCIEDDESYEIVKAAKADVTKVINRVESVREKLKKPALDYGRAVDAEAKRITTALEKVRKPLADELSVADQHRHEAKMALIAKQESEEKKRLQDIEDARLADIKRQNDELDAKRKEIEAQQAKLATEQAELDKAAKAAQECIAAAQKAENDRLMKIADDLAAKAQKVRDAEQAAERAEFEAQAKIKAEADAKAALERQQAEDALRAKEAEEAALAEAARIEAARPDVDKVHAFADAIISLRWPSDIKNKEAESAVTNARRRLEITANDLKAFKIN